MTVRLRSLLVVAVLATVPACTNNQDEPDTESALPGILPATEDTVVGGIAVPGEEENRQ